MKKYLKWLIILSILSLTIFLIFSLRKEDNGNWKFGFGSLNYESTWSIVDSNYNSIIGSGEMESRILQFLISFLGGGALAFAGVLLQKVTKNRLAEVSILGIGSINILFIYIYVKAIGVKSFGSGWAGILMPILLILFSILGTLIIWFISKSKKANKNTFVIVGIAIQLLAEAISVVFVNPISLINGTKSEQQIWHKIKSYTLGNVRADINNNNSIPWWLIIFGIIVIFIIIVIALIMRKKIDTYEISEDLASSTGINTKKMRFTIFMLVAVLAGIASSIIGTVALLGVIAPSIGRMIFKNEFLKTSISSFLIGGILVAFASWLSMNANWHLPVGILSTAIVIPYFIFLIVRGK